jgi:hypothetical protein
MPGSKVAPYRMKSSEFLPESSGNSLAGSYTNDLVISKLWLAHELNKILAQQQIQSVPVAYVLGSWYGNASTILRKMRVPIDQIIDVDRKKSWLQKGAQIQQDMGITGVQQMHADANNIDYRQLEQPGVVINTSTNDIADQGWFDNIPSDTIVVLQGRDQVENNGVTSPDELLERFPLETVLYQGTWDLEDPETEYRRSMAIGINGQQQLRELSFLGSQCTKDCSGHRAGYAWSGQRSGRVPNSWSPSFNKGAWLQRNGY